MTKFSNDAEKNLLMYLFDNLFLEDIVQKLCNFLSEEIPFDKIILSETHLASMQVRTIFEYSLNSYSFKPRVNPIAKRIPPGSPSLYRGNYQQIAYWKDIRLLKYHRHASEIYPQAKSLLTLSLHPEAEEDIFQSLFFFSNKINTFTDEHLNLIDSLQKPIRHMCTQLINNYREQSSFLFCHNTLSSDPELLLKQCPGLSEITLQIQDIAPTDSTVLIYGETGVGKELVAKAIYALSSRSENVLKTINCGALTPSLLDSELFGVVKGAYTGAIETKKGIFESAHGGTLCLDEIGELSLDAQTRLLRVLEAREIRRVGDNKNIPIDVRIIASTNKDLEGMVEQGTFRSDLLYRLSVIPLYIPPLSERPEDIPVLTQYFYNTFIQELNMNTPPKLTEKIMQQLQSTTWTGNVRQLKHTIERSLILGKNHKEFTIINSIRPMLQKKIPKLPRLSKPFGKPTTEDNNNPEYFEVLSALIRCQNRIEGPHGAAQFMGINPSTFRYKMKQFGLAREKRY